MKRLLFGVLVFWATTAFAQTYKQKGVVRMITSSASAPATPVKGVNVVVGNHVSGTTGADGAFRVDVTKEFVVSGIAQEDYILALPTRGRTYYYSKNDLDVVVTTKVQREADYKKLYQQIREKYDAQTDEVNRLRREYKQKLNDLDKADAEYVDLQVKLDSLQALYEEIIDNEDNIDDLISDISDDLAITDYLLLDDFNRKIFDLKCAGEWKSISDLLNDVMHGDAASYLQSAIDNKEKAAAAKKKAEALERAAREDLAARFRHVEDAIKAFKMQHLNDSVSRYYEILTKAAPENWEYLVAAARFEDVFTSDYEKAMQYYEKAIALNIDEKSLATTYDNIGVTYRSEGEYEKALEYFQKGLDLRLKTFGEDNPDVAVSYNNIGSIQDIYFKDYPKAMEYFEKALKINLSVFGPKHLSVVKDYNSLGIVSGYIGEFEKALDYHRKAIAIYLENGDENDPSVANSYNNMGIVYAGMKDYDKALECYEKALEIRRTIFTENHADVAISYNTIGSIYFSLGELDTAAEYFEKALNIRKEIFGEINPSVAMSYYNTGAVHEANWNYAVAKDYYLKALDIYSKFLPEDHPNLEMIKHRIDTCEEGLNNK